MQLRGIDFPAVMNAAGAQGFFGEGYFYHKAWRLLGLTFQGCGFVAKTTTLHARPGNMPLKEDGITPREWWPRCIVVNPIAGLVLNSVGLSGPGAAHLLKMGLWQRRNGAPFFLSFMSVAEKIFDRLEELREFVTLLAGHLPHFNTRVGLEINFSCPNTGLDPSKLINEVGQAFDCADRLGIPLQAKFNATIPVNVACEVCSHQACDAITMSNTIPWGQLPHRINWKELFGSDVSPLMKKLGGGGLSGWPLLPIVCDWIAAARDCGFQKPIMACGGIDCVRAVRRVHRACASGIQLGSVAIVRPWRMRDIIAVGTEIFSR